MCDASGDACCSTAITIEIERRVKVSERPGVHVSVSWEQVLPNGAGTLRAERGVDMAATATTTNATRHRNQYCALSVG